MSNARYLAFVTSATVDAINSINASTHEWHEFDAHDLSDAIKEMRSLLERNRDTLRYLNNYAERVERDQNTATLNKFYALRFERLLDALVDADVLLQELGGDTCNGLDDAFDILMMEG